MNDIDWRNVELVVSTEMDRAAFFKGRNQETASVEEWEEYYRWLEQHRKETQ